VYNHKYGFHINAVSQPVWDAIDRLRPALLKTLHHDVTFWKAVRKLLPNAFIIGRLYTANQEFEDNPVKRGREFAERILKEGINHVEVNGRLVYDAWESFNEVLPEVASAERQKKYDEFQVAFGQKIKAEGFEPVAMNFGTGNFLGHHFIDNFPGTLDTYKYLGFHEYDWPTLDRLHKIGLEDGNGGMWLALRYRRAMQAVQKKFGRKHTAIITEVGMTQGVQGGQDVGPWHKSHPISVDDYWKSLRWYNDEIMKDDYVLGACLFAVGAIDPWQSFEHLGPVMDKLADFQRDPSRPVSPTIDVNQPVVTNPPDTTTTTSQPTAEKPMHPAVTSQPAVTPTSPPADDDLRSQYVLFPKGTPVWWYVAAAPYLSHFTCTHGENLADALRLAASRAHTITCVNPSAETLARIRRHRPAPRLDIIDVDSPDMLAAALEERLQKNAPFG